MNQLIKSTLRKMANLCGMSALIALSFIAMPTAQATPIELVTNGGFETGSFAGWSVINTGNGGCGTNAWTVNGTGAHGCTNNVGNMPAPSSGSFAAYNTFDGPASTMSIAQQISIGNFNTASLSFLNTVRMNIRGLARTLSIDIYDITNTNLLANLFSQSYQNINQGWSANLLDVSAQLAGLKGQTATLRVSTIIPQSFTGPAGFGIDDISLTTTNVPTPTTLALLGLGLVGLGFSRRKKA